MKTFRNRVRSRYRAAIGVVAAATAVGLTVLVTSPGTAVPIDPDELAEAHGQVIDTDLITADLLDVSSARSTYPSSPEADHTPLDVAALQALSIQLPNVSLPLISGEDGNGLLHLGEVGALNAFGHAPSFDSAVASAGAVGQDGAINVDPDNPGAYGNATVSLTPLLEQLGLSDVTDEVVDELSLELGALASRAEADADSVTSDYVVADGKLTISSPAVSRLSDSLQVAVDKTGQVLDDAIGDEGLVSELATIGIDANVLLGRVSVGGAGAEVSVETRDALNSVVENVIREKLEDRSGIVSIDIGGGDIVVDLAKIVEGGNGEDLNGLAPNTEVLTSATITTITDAVADALGALTGRVNDTLTEALDNVHLIIELPATISLLGQTITGGVTVDATLGQLAGTDTTRPTVTTDLRISVLGTTIDAGAILNVITTPVIDAVLGITEPIIGNIITATADEVSNSVQGIVDPLLTTLDPVFEALNQVIGVTINEQVETPVPQRQDATRAFAAAAAPTDLFTVSAVSLEVLPGVDAVDVNLASSSVRTSAQDEADPDANTNAAASASA
ncbi:choice-of-anchor G family protein, partial [Brevibacterium sanguinis]|uniref:choice-of-anchor G family protein n=1 Tax=Brevibacterium sanguinis TaxID=232444 RepID=UPI0031DEA112